MVDDAGDKGCHEVMVVFDRDLDGIAG